VYFLDYYIVVDIGATRTRIGLADVDGLKEKIVFDTPRVGDEYTIAEMIYRIASRSYRGLMDRVKAVSVATIGPLDLRRGRVVNTPNIPIHRIELLSPLRRLFNKPVYVVNDAVAAVYGEKYYGYGVDYRNIVYITLSTGVGGGVIVDDHLLLGKSGNAHEIGHIVVDFKSNVKCGCGGYGHWEAFAGGANIPRLAKIMAEEYSGVDTEAWRKASKGELDPPTLFKLYREGDRFAEIVVNTIIKACIAGFSSTINIYDPELITIGGSIYLNNEDIFYNRIIEGVRSNIVTEPPVIKTTKLREDIVLYGALAIAVNPPKHLIDFQKG